MKKSSIFLAVVIVAVGAILIFGGNSKNEVAITTGNNEIAVTGSQEFIINNIPLDLPRSVSVGLVSFANESNQDFGKKAWTIEAKDGGKIHWGGEGAQNCATLESLSSKNISECMDVNGSAVYIESDDSTVEALDVFREMKSQL